jgi:Fic family protein
MIQWLKYFLVGVAETAENATKTLTEILELKAKLELQITTTFGKRSSKAAVLLQYLFKKPVVHVNQIKDMNKSSYKSANDLVSEFVNAGILKEMTGQNRNRIFVFDEYLKMFERK